MHPAAALLAHVRQITADQRNKAKDAIWKNGLLVLPCGERSLRFRPPLNLSAAEADTGLDLVRRSLKQL